MTLWKGLDKAASELGERDGEKAQPSRRGCRSPFGLPARGGVKDHPNITGGQKQDAGGSLITAPASYSSSAASSCVKFSPKLSNYEFNNTLFVITTVN